jgi:hypothetical protein
MNRTWTRGAPILVVVALAACGASAGGTTAPVPSSAVAPTEAPSVAPTVEPRVTPPVTPKPVPVDPTPVLSPGPSGASVLSSDLVDVLAVRCDADGLELGSDRVRAVRDGVRFTVTGEPGYQVGFEHEMGGGGFEVDIDTPDRVELIPPGAMTVTCGPASAPDPGPVAAVNVEDPDGLYRPYQVGPGVHACVSGDAMYGEDARGPAVPPVEQARAGLVGLLPGDMVQRAGYPVETGRVRVVRNGEVIGRLDYEPDGHGGWLLMSTSLCDGLGAGG